MAKSDPDTIILGGVDERQYDEGVADGASTPGDLLERTGTVTSGAKDRIDVARQSSDGTKVIRRVAIEAERGGVGRDLDDDYADGQEVSFVVLEPGDTAYLRVFDGDNAGASGTDVSANANISEGDRLVAYGGAGVQGTLRAFDSDSEGAALFEAQEDQDNSSGSSPARIKVEAL